MTDLDFDDPFEPKEQASQKGPALDFKDPFEQPSGGSRSKPAASPPADSALSKVGDFVAEQFKGTGGTPYQDAIDNPVTRGLAQAGNIALTGVTHIGRRLVGALSPEAGEAIRSNIEAPLVEQGKQLAVPEGAGFGASALQTLANVGGQLSLARATGGESVLGTAARLGVPSAGAEAAEREAATGDEVSTPRLAAMAAANTIANTIGLKLPGGLPGRLAGGGLSNVAGNALSNVAAGNAPLQGAIPAALLGVGLGALPHGERGAAPAPRPELTPDLAGHAADLAAGVDAHTAQLALPPGQGADFVAGANGETMTPEQARARAAGGPGMEAQGPGGPPAPVVPEPPAPLALGHEPDVIVDARGRAVVNKGDRTLGQPFGGPGLDEQAPPPSGPLGRAADAAAKTPGALPPEAAAPEAVTNPEAPPEAPSAAAAAPQTSAPLEAFAAREAQIDALNTKRKSAGLTDDENNQLHDLRDQQDLVNPKSGIPNRKAFDQAMASGEYSHAVAMDIDGFKAINDTLGHGVGDLVLQHLGSRLANESNGDIIFSHNSGDEYAAASKGDPSKSLASLQAELAKTPFTVEYVDSDGHTVQHTLNGIGLTFGVGKTLHEADIAANASKEQRANAGLRRRREDIGSAAVRPEDVPAAEGSNPEGGVAGGPGTVQREQPAAASGRKPTTVATSVGDVRVDRTHDIPLLGSSLKDGTVVLDKDWNPVVDAARAKDAVDAVATGADTPAVRKAVEKALSGYDRTKPVAVHEKKEATSEKAGADYSKSHFDVAEPAEHAQLLSDLGFKAGSPEADLAIRAYEHTFKPDLVAAAAKKNPNIPADIIQKPYDHPHNVEQRKLLDEVDADVAKPAESPEPVGSARAGEGAQATVDRGGEPAPRDVQSQSAEGVVSTPLHERATAEGESRVAATESAKADAAAEAAGVDLKHNFVKAETGATAKGAEPKFARGSTGGMAHDKLQAAISKVVQGWRGDAPKVLVHQSHADAPEGLRNARGFDHSVEAGYDNGTVHLFADAIHSPQRALDVLAHEAYGHYGMEAAFGDHWGKLVSDISKLRQNPPASLRAIFSEVERRYTIKDEETGEKTKPDNETFASEALAVMAEKGVRNALMDRVVTAIRQFLRKLGFAQNFSAAELRQMLVAAKRRVEGQNSAAEQRGARESLQPAFSKPEPDKLTVAYAGDRFVQRDRLAQRKFDKPYAKLSADDKADVDTLFQSTSGERNPMFSKADAAGAGETKPAESFLDRATGLFKPSAADRATRALKAVALQGRELARGVSRAAWAARDRAVGTADAAIDAFRSHFDARPAAVRSDPLKSYDSVIAYQQKRPIADPVERKFIDTMAKMLDAQATAIRKFGEDKLGLLDQYFPQLWKDPGRAEKMYADMQAKRPLAGAKGFTKERVFADYEQGIKAGMEPAFDNPADALMARYQSGERYLSALRIRDGIDRLGLLKDIAQGDRVPQGYARVNDNSFAGKVVPELVAKDLNNYLAPGLTQFKAWRGFRWMQNTLLSARLGFSAFHAGFTTVDSAMTHLDLGMRRALDGDISAALKHLAQIPLTPLKALQGLAGKGEGAKLVRQFYGKDAIEDPHTAAVLNALTEGGARGRMDPTDYNNDFAQTLRAFRTDGAAALAKTPLRTFGAVLEAAMRPIAHNLVPAQKMTARVDLMKYELDRVAGQLGKQKGDYAGITQAMNQDALRQIAHTVVQRVDDRLGQLAYDNLFWNRTVKDILQASIQSVGWNVGTKNVIFGGLGDVRKIFNPEKLLAPLDKEGKITDAQMSRVTGRLSYLVALNLGIGTLGAVTQYLLTGEGPQELRDYFFPKTGNKNPDGSDARMSFPSYVKDEFGFARHPLDTIQHKLHPSFSMVAELLNNKDFYGNQVYNPDDPWSKVAGQVAGHIVGGFEPYAFQNQANVAAAGGGLGARVAPFFGVTPAPGDITHSDFQNYLRDKYYSSHPSASKSPEKADASHAFSQAVQQVRAGAKPDLTQFTPADRAKINKYGHERPEQYIEKQFAGLNLQQKLAAYDRASAAERTQYQLRLGIMRSKWANELQQIPDEDERAALRSRVQKIMGSK